MKNRIYAGLLAALTAAGIVGYNYYQKEESQSSPKSNVVKQSIVAKGIGFIDLKRIQDSVDGEGRLEEIKSRELRLQLELKDAMKPVIITPPKVEDKPFDDSIWQKNAQTIISEAAEIQNRKKKAAEDYKKSTEGEYFKKRDAANDKFLNEIFNIKLKLQNADHLRLKTDEINALYERLDEIKTERNQLQIELINQWTQEIEDYAEKAVKEDVAKLRAQAEEARSRVTEEAKQSQIAAQERNRQLMQQAMQDSMARQDRRKQLMSELQDVTEERVELESKITDNISNLAAKLAAMHKLNMVLVSKELDFTEDFLSLNFNSTSILNDKIPNGAVILFSADNLDLTEELIAELNRQALFRSKN